jgi:redox-sensitive bicupin YhaK (pirin superfamily)
MKITKSAKIEFPLTTQDPFLFGVYHKDIFPAGNDKCETTKYHGNGMDFNQDAEYRMYHGVKVPGFPRHPHAGFETITCTIEGFIDHSDSLGCSGRYGNGDLQWMTAGKGIVHGENFPLLNPTGPNICRFFQLWINLERSKKGVEPAQIMHWSENIVKISSEEYKATLWAGSLMGRQALPPPKNSWANNPENNVAIYFVELKRGGCFTLPEIPEGVNRSVYFITGKCVAEDIAISDQRFIQTNHEQLAIKNQECDLLEFLVLQGKPIGEPVAHQGPFVSNSREGLSQVIYNYQRTGFGGWPYDQDAVIFPREQSRFVKINGKIQEPPKN